MNGEEAQNDERPREAMADGAQLPRNLRRRGYPDDYLKLRDELRGLLEQESALRRAAIEARDAMLRWQVLVAQIVASEGGEVAIADFLLSELPDALELTHDPNSATTTVRAVWHEPRVAEDGSGESPSGRSS